MDYQRCAVAADLRRHEAKQDAAFARGEEFDARLPEERERVRSYFEEDFFAALDEDCKDDRHHEDLLIALGALCAKDAGIDAFASFKAALTQYIEKKAELDLNYAMNCEEDR
jgi:uncharacterized protein HemY